jgi:hypothetical protein
MLRGLGNSSTIKVKDIFKYRATSILIPCLVRVNIPF